MMNIHYQSKWHSLWIIAVLLLLQSGHIMATFFSQSLTREEFKARYEQDAPNHELSNFTIDGFTLPVKRIENISLKQTEWNDINADGVEFSDVHFVGCKITSSSFNGAKLTNVTFTKCEIVNGSFKNAVMTNVKFEKSKLSDGRGNPFDGFLRIKAKPIYINESELNSISFFESEGEFYINDSDLVLTDIYALKNESVIEVNNSRLKGCDFGKSSLKSLTLRKTKAIQSKANNCRIGTILLEDSDLDFPIGDGKGYGKVIAKNTDNIIIGGSPVKEVEITDCRKSNDIFLADMKFDSMYINNCKPADFVFYDSVGKKMTVSNVETSRFDLEDADIEHLVLNNVFIRVKLFYDNAKIKKLETHNITFGDNIKIKSEGANIEIKPDAIKKIVY